MPDYSLLLMQDSEYQSTLRSWLRSSITAKTQLLESEEVFRKFDEACRVVENAFQTGGRLYVAGNGGSAADAQHMAAEFVSKLARDRSPLPAEALSTDTSILTAIGNDYGYEKVFSRQIAAKCRAQDVFIGITTSGSSPNILLALQECRRLGVKTILFAGRDGGAAKNFADIVIIAPGDGTSIIQENHISLAHALVAAVEYEHFFRKETKS